MRLFLTDHGREAIKKRWDGKQINPFLITKKAWEKGRMMTDHEMKVFFRKWALDARNQFMPEVRVFAGYQFIFRADADIVRLVTMYKPFFRFNPKKKV